MDDKSLIFLLLLVETNRFENLSCARDFFFVCCHPDYISGDSNDGPIQFYLEKLIIILKHRTVFH